MKATCREITEQIFNNTKLDIMKKYLFISFAALAAMVSCEQENGPVQGTEPEEGRREVTIVADASETKTTLSQDAVLWENGDAVRLLFTPEAGTDLQVHTEEFTTATPGATATFTGSIPNNVKYASDGSAYSDDLYMVYPSTAMDENTGEVTFELKAEQSVAPGSFPSGLNLSSARVSFEDLETKGTANATFLNAFSIIRFTLPADVKALKITGTGNLAGEAELGFDSNARLGAETFVSGSKSVTLTPSEGTAFAEGETYNILVYPGNHSAITVDLTDTDNCTYSKTVTKNFDFEAAMYYTFNFNTDFGKDFNFTVTGVSITDDEIVKAVFTDDQADYAFDVVVNDNAFSVRLPHEVTATTGYAVYPASAYSEGEVNYSLTATEAAPALYTAALDCASTSAAFNSVTAALSTMKFTVPAGVSSVTLTSTVGFAGNTVMTVGADGKMTAGAGDVTTVTLDPATAGEVVLNVYPFSNATITLTLKDAANAVNTQTFAAQSVAAGAELTLEVEQNIEFEKGGSFENEGFNNGGDTIEF